MATTEFDVAPYIPHFLVKQLGAQKHGLQEAELATKIKEVEIQTQILGASFIKIHIIDPEWEVITSGLVAVDEDGLLNELVVEFPTGTGYFWQLAMIEGTTDINDANLILTFEDHLIANLRKQWGHRTIPSGLTTRAQFVRALVEETNLKDHLNPKIRFVSPGVNRIEPIAEAKPTKTKTAQTKAAMEAEKARGVHAGAEFKIKGLAPTAIQRAIINEALTVANEKNAGTLATEALIEAMITENTVSNSGAGLLQFEGATAAGVGVTKGNVKSEVTAFLTKSYSGETLSTGPGGAIEYARKNPNAPAYEVAQAVQGSGAGKASKGSANYGPFAMEAQEILHVFGGISAGGTKTNAKEKSDIGQLARGTTTNPDEDSWDCITRLGQEVNWNAFTDGRNTLFFMDGPDLVAQRPVLYIDGETHDGQRLPPSNWRIIREDKGGQKEEEFGALIRPLSFTYDNTAFEYRATHKVKQRVQRKSKISKPQTPSEIRMLVLCGITEYRAGDVFVFRNCGPISENGGRWIVSDATREVIKYPYTKFILVPPTEPLPEPKATGAAATPSPGTTGTALSAFDASSELSSFELPYVWGGGHEASGLTNVKKGGHGLDCSGSVCWVLKQAGMFSGSSAVAFGALETFGEAGEGKEMTVWAGPNHTYIEFNIPGHAGAQLNTNGVQNGPRLYTLSLNQSYNGPKGAGSGGPFVARHAKGT